METSPGRPVRAVPCRHQQGRIRLHTLVRNPVECLRNQGAPGRGRAKNKENIDLVLALAFATDAEVGRNSVPSIDDFVLMNHEAGKWDDLTTWVQGRSQCWLWRAYFGLRFRSRLFALSGPSSGQRGEPMRTNELVLWKSCFADNPPANPWDFFAQSLKY